MQERKLRTAWIVRQKYRRLSNIMSVAGAILGLLVVAALARQSADDHSGSMRGLIVASIGIILVTSMGPRLIVKGLWRRARRRNFWEWQ